MQNVNNLLGSLDFVAMDASMKMMVKPATMGIVFSKSAQAICQIARCAAQIAHGNWVHQAHGDGIIDEQLEQCDDGNRETEACEYGVESCVVCSAECAQVMGETSLCGDGVTDLTHEDCDDGNQLNDDDCVDNCSAARCGDGHIRNEIEQCDDGNTETEACDYGLEACTVCDANCMVVPGRTRQCGDSIVEEDIEECDDGNTQDGDGCDAECVDLNGRRHFPTLTA